jgi:flagellar motility protein MotE (MotC chaperone)
MAQTNRFWTSPRLLLPVLIMLGTLVLGLRIEDIWGAAESGKLFSSASAQSKSEAKQTPPPASAATPPMAPSADTIKANETKPAADAKAADGKPEAASPVDEDVSPAEIEVLKQLSSRRAQLDKQTRDLDMREALTKVAEQRIDQKIKEMETLRQQLQGMVNQANEGQAQQIENLVKIYETMKPDDAAKIFDNLDMPVLLGVIQRMKPKSTAPIMAKMSPEKAKEITVALTKQPQLPQIK